MKITHIPCRHECEQRRSHNDKSDVHAASSAFTKLDNDKKVTTAASTITSHGGMCDDYQVGSSHCLWPPPSFQLLAVQESRISINASDRKRGWGLGTRRLCVFWCLFSYMPISTWGTSHVQKVFMKQLHWHLIRIVWVEHEYMLCMCSGQYSRKKYNDSILCGTCDISVAWHRVAYTTVLWK